MNETVKKEVLEILDQIQGAFVALNQPLMLQKAQKAHRLVKDGCQHKWGHVQRNPSGGYDATCLICGEGGHAEERFW